MSREMKKLNEFDAVDADGEIYRISHMQDVIENRLLDGSIHRENGLQSFNYNGKAVNQIDENTYEIVQLGRRVTRKS
jgi:hypothetical protein